MSDRYQKLSIALQNYLYGARYHKALLAFDFARKYHTGKRKDGITPEFQHQIEIALFIITLRDVENEESAIIAALLHDVLEDYDDVDPQDIINLVGYENMLSVVALSKSVKGVQQYKHIQDYFNGIANDKVASIVKGSDRIHNLRTMNGAFTLVKQEEYVFETDEYFLPMLKHAAGSFPMQYLAYMNIRTMLKTQVELVKAMLIEVNKIK